MIDAEEAVPAELHHRRFVATPLTVDVAELDFAAYMASPDVIRVHSDGRWRVGEFTLAEDVDLIARHQLDHERNKAFAFVLLAPSRDQALGCLYINSLRVYLQRAGATAELLHSIPRASALVSFWLRQDQQGTGLADELVGAVNGWLLSDWPLSMHLFRVLPNERSSRTALDRLGLRQVRLPLTRDRRPYLWYRP